MHHIECRLWLPCAVHWEGRYDRMHATGWEQTFGSAWNDAALRRTRKGPQRLVMKRRLLVALAQCHCLKCTTNLL